MGGDAESVVINELLCKNQMESVAFGSTTKRGVQLEREDTTGAVGLISSLQANRQHF